MFIELFKETVSRYADQIGVTWKGEDLTWREVDDSVSAVASGIQRLGVGKGDCVALILDNTPTFVISFLAAIRLGAPVLPINRSVQSAELFQIISDSNVKMIISENANIPACRDILDAVESDAIVVVNGGACPGVDVMFPQLVLSDIESDVHYCHGEDDLVVQYSSGSTGRSKRLSRSHAMCVADAKNHSATLSIDASDSIFCTAPLFHTYAMGNCFFASVSTGARLILFSDASPFSLYRKQCLALIEKEQPTMLVTVPYVCAQLVEVSGEYDFSSIRIATTAGSALSSDVFGRFLSKFNVPLRQLYGCTEAGTLTVNLDKDIATSFATVGNTIEGVTIKVVDEGHQPVPARTIGEIAVRTKTLTRGYDGLHDLNREVFKGNFFYTGDLGWLDDAGRLTLTGRKIKYILVHGNKVDPVEVEDVLLEHPFVDDAVVVGVAKKTGEPMEEIVKAVVVCSQPCAEPELINWCRKRLANFKIPGVVLFMDEIPKNPMGKVLRKLLV